MLLLLSIFSCYQYKIKLSNTEQYIKNDLDKKNSVLLGDFGSADTFRMVVDSNTNILKWFYPLNIENRSLTYDDIEKVLKYDVYRGADNQAFELVPVDFFERSFWILNSGDCLTWVESNKKFMTESCYDNEPNQIFEFVAIDFDYNDLINTDADLDAHQVNVQFGLNHDGNDVSYMRHIEKENKSILMTVYKILYDMNLCFGNKGTCLAPSKTNESIFARSGFSSSSRSASMSASSASSKSSSYSAKSKFSSSKNYNSASSSMTK